MVLLQAVTQVAHIDWVPYALGGMGIIISALMGLWINSLLNRIAAVEAELKKQEDARVARNEKIAEMFATRDLKVLQDISEIKEILASIKP